MVTGSCLCGDVAWAVSGPLELMSHCHCSMCRKAHGSAFATYVGARERFHIYCGSKAPWYDIPDGLPQFEEGPGLA